ncbi:hypothetical protein K439DRAFT_1622030 [Ramaria rubella]|nr:hypothetical protein K439DRAFT_1622030 [Ramaria rubella]
MRRRWRGQWHTLVPAQGQTLCRVFWGMAVLCAVELEVVQGGWDELDMVLPPPRSIVQTQLASGLSPSASASTSSVSVISVPNKWSTWLPLPLVRIKQPDDRREVGLGDHHALEGALGLHLNLGDHSEALVLHLDYVLAHLLKLDDHSVAHLLCLVKLWKKQDMLSSLIAQLLCITLERDDLLTPEVRLGHEEVKAVAERTNLGLKVIVHVDEGGGALADGEMGKVLSI